LNHTQYTPLGVVGCISPWNLPLYLLTWKIAPALAMGNTVVAKPSEITPYTAQILAQIATEVGLPPGVLNIVQGEGPKAGSGLVAHPEIKAVSFTGSTATGRSVAETAARSFKKYSLEMGGKNPNVIFADCDFDAALEKTVESTFDNQGQICLCGSRILVEQSIYNKFRDALVERTKTLKMGDPLDEKTEQGAVVSEPHMKKVLSYFDIARSEGGKVLIGGERATMPGELSKGYFIKPTLIEGLGPNARVNQDEIFGPVATLIPFSDECEAIEMANCTRYGLSASVWSRDLDKANRVASAIQAGVVWVNTWMLRDLRTPFGGVKESGVGREGGEYGLKFFAELKTVCVGLKP
jgi:aminomuconate-semialdehyde/2-hydroxymuconate-6-semialdehyde dehydrogenase